MKRIVYHIIAAAAAVCLWGCGENYPRENILKIYNWSDYIDEDLIEEFEEWYEEQTGEPVHIVYQLFDINEVMLAKIERGFADFDLACPSDYIIERMIAHDLVLPIEKDFGDTPDYLGNVSPYMNNLLSKVEGNGKNPNDYAVPYMWGTTGFLYNSKMVKAEELTSWKALWNPKFAQKMFIKDAFRDVYCPLLIYAKYDEIMAGTVDIDSLMYDTSDESIALVESMLSEIRPSVLGWEADFGKEMMTQEVALLNLSWSGDAKWAIDEALDVGVELDYIVPSEGSNVWFDGWVIPKYAVNTKAASYFINYMCKPENAIRNMDVVGYVSAVATPEVLETMIETAIEWGRTEPIDASYFFGPEADSVILDPVLYADKSIIDRCALMHDSGDRTEALLEMWQRVKGDSLNNWILILISVTLATMLVLGIRRKILKRHK